MCSFIKRVLILHLFGAKRSKVRLSTYGSSLGQLEHVRLNQKRKDKSGTATDISPTQSSDSEYTQTWSSVGSMESSSARMAA